MVNLILSAFADEYSDNFIQQVSALRTFGIEYLEIRGVDGKNVSELTKSDIKRVKSILNDYGVKVSSIGSPLGKIKIDDDLRAHIEVANKVFDAANELGVRNCRIFSFYAPKGKRIEDYKAQVFEGLTELLRVAEKHNVLLCHENEANIYGETPQKCLEILDYFGGQIRCVFDMGNFVLDGSKPYPDAYKTLFSYIEYFHIKDALKEGAVVPAGCGEGNIKELLSDYKANGKKDAFITLEPHLQTFSGLNALVGKKFDNPYKYRSREEAFIDALNKLKSISEQI